MNCRDVRSPLLSRTLEIVGRTSVDHVRLAFPAASFPILCVSFRRLDLSSVRGFSNPRSGAHAHALALTRDLSHPLMQRFSGDLDGRSVSDSRCAGVFEVRFFRRLRFGRIARPP